MRLHPRPARRPAALMGLAGLLSTTLLVAAPVTPTAPASAEPQFAPTTLLDRKAKPLRATSNSPVAAGSTVIVKGTVKTRGKKKRPVRLLAKQGRKYVVVRKSKSTKKGRFALAHAAGSKVRARKYRVVTPKFRGLRAAKVNVKVKVVTATPPPPVQQPTIVTATFTPVSTVVPGGAAPVATGTVIDSETGARTVVAQQAFPDGWADVASTTSNADGSYALTVPGDWLYDLDTRIVATPTPTSAAAASPTARLTTAPSWTPHGSAAAWSSIGALSGNTERWRFNPCRVIRYRTNTAAAGALAPQAEQAFHDAVARISYATGLRFQYLGTSDIVYNPTSGPAFPVGTDLLLSWGTQAQTKSPYAGGIMGWGGPWQGYRSTDAFGPVLDIHTSGVVLNPTPQYQGWTPHSLLSVSMHEVGHAVGLGHSVGDESQIMAAMYTPANPITWGAGDVTGLKTVGRGQGCVAANAPYARTKASPLVKGPGLLP